MRKALVFLGVLDDADIGWMIRTGVKRAVPPGQAIVREGRSIESLFIVLSGLFSVQVGAQGSGPGQEVAQLRSGEVVGEISFVDSRPPTATVIAAENSRVLEISRSDLMEKIEEDTAFGSRFYRALAMFLGDRLRASVERLGYGKSAPGKEDIDELSPEMLEMVSLAGTRFQQMEAALFGG